MERKIGEIIDFEGHKLEVTENISCKGCFFAGKGSCAFRKNVVGFCDSTNRDDGKSIIFKDITNMKDGVNEIKITVPEGMEIDKENSTFECIKFKKKEEVAWRNKKEKFVSGFYINACNSTVEATDDNIPYDEEVYDTFATEKQAKSALAMAQISQIMANDERFGGVVTDEEWCCDGEKYVIYRYENSVIVATKYTTYSFLAFHTIKQRDMFLEENEDLVKDYLMID